MSICRRELPFGNGFGASEQMKPLVQEAARMRPELIRSHDRRIKSPSLRRWPRRLLIVAGLMLLAAILLLGFKWPFTESQVIAALEDQMQGKLKFGKFHQTFFPFPGCVAEDVTLTAYGHLPNPNPITVRKLTIQGSYRGLLNRHVPVLRVEGAHLLASGAGYFNNWKFGEKSKATVDRLIFNSSLLEISRAGRPPLPFAITEITLENSPADGGIGFQAVLRNPKPDGEVRGAGSLGPWNKEDPGKTPLSGTYSFQHANLGVFHSIAGTLCSTGKFQGTLQQLIVEGSTEIPDFQVTDTGHKIGLAAEFQARVNARNGDVILESITARLGKSPVNSRGSIAGRAGEKGKRTSLAMAVRSGRIQDFLYLFLRDPVPPMNGAFTFTGHAALPSGPEPFTRRVQLEGDFAIAEATLNSTTQDKLDELSERAEGEKNDAPERIASELKGQGVLRGGTATFSHLTFRVPGAAARLHGTYSLLSHRIDLHGKLFTRASLSQATSGVKSFVLKIISPVLRKNRHGGGVVALSVTGFYPHPDYNTAPLAGPR